MIPYSITSNSISVLIDYQMRVVPSTAINFNQLRDELRKPNPDIKRLKDLVDIPSFLAKVTIGAIRISADEVYFHNEKVNGYAATRLLKHLEDGDPIEPLAHLLEKLMANPNAALRNDLWLWIEEGNLPICADGDIVAFKKVSDDYKSLRPDTDGTLYDHHIGKVPAMDRKRCNENRYDTCSAGLHFCSYRYLSQYEGTRGRVVIVKINPRDIVAIPSDHSNQKGRACTYAVVGEVPLAEANKFFSGNVVSRVGTYDERNKPTPPPQTDWNNATPVVEEAELIDDPTEPIGPITKVKITISGRKFNWDRVKDLVDSIGQRGAAKKLKVPRTSLQDALKKAS